MPKRRASAQQRRAVARRARGCCEYCASQASFATQSFSIEHILPLDQGGLTKLDNLELACQGCNNHKHVKTEGIDPVSNVLVPLYNPRHQRWCDHFAWEQGCASVVGVTPTGRAEGLVGLAHAFFTAGASRLVASLWEVKDDEVTVRLMESFYRELLAGRPPADALRRAQLELHEEGVHSSRWSAFVLIGPWDPLAPIAPVLPAAHSGGKLIDGR